RSQPRQRRHIVHSLEWSMLSTRSTPDAAPRGASSVEPRLILPRYGELHHGRGVPAATLRPWLAGQIHARHYFDRRGSLAAILPFTLLAQSSASLAAASATKSVG